MSLNSNIIFEQIAASIQSPVNVTPSRSFQSFPRSQDTSFTSPPVRSCGGNRSSLSPSDSFSQHSTNSSTQTTSSCTPSPTTAPNSRNSKQHYQRPSTLHGLKHKLHSTGCPKTLHAAGPSCTASVPNRRKSVGHIPLSPLARTPSPSPLPASPTRSPSPLAFPIGHQPGSSNTTQSYSPSAGTAPIAISAQSKKGFARAKSGEPGSPLLRRALSPDRLHPRSAETKCSISPLCSSGTSTASVKTQSRSTNSPSVWRPTNTQPERDKDLDNDNIQTNEQTSSSSSSSSNTSENRLSLNLSCPGELLPRIAEEKDSPTNGQELNKQQQQHDAKCDKDKLKTITQDKNLKTNDDSTSNICDKRDCEIDDKKVQVKDNKDKMQQTSSNVSKIEQKQKKSYDDNKSRGGKSK